MNAQERADAALVLEGAYDELLVNGRSGSFVDEEGHICVINALGRASRRLFLTSNPANNYGIERDEAARTSAAKALQGRIATGNIVSWNWDSTDDEVFDTLLSTAKALREEAGVS